MDFRTQYKPSRSQFTLDPSRPAVTLGSCFADNIATRMRLSLWNARNPFGVLYNPLSIARAIDLSLAPADASGFEASLVERQGVWHSWLFDSKISSLEKEGCVRKYLKERELFLNMLDKAQALFVTFGTAWCYYLSERQDYVVANCHKFPAATFTRRRLSVTEITECWIPLAERIRDLYPNLKIVFTVSPVRHIKDGLEENTLSKATLRLAVDEICSRLPFCSYFPAYEILLDDLRDYRFYADDLVHPSSSAVDYIWEIFRATYIDNAGEAFLKEGESILRALNHRPLIDIPAQTALFREKTLARYTAFRRLHPDILPLPASES